MTSYVYKITCLVNDKVYIGKADNIKKRWNDHKADARRKEPGRYFKIHRALNKYGFDNFIVEEIASFDTVKEALISETEFIKIFRSMEDEFGYNMTEGGDGAKGFRFTEEQKSKMNQDKKEIFLGENNPFYGKNHIEETKDFLSNFIKQRYQSDPERYHQLNVEQCDFNKDDCLEIQKRYLERDITFEELAELFDTNLHAIHNIIHGTYAAIRGFSIITEKDIEDIKQQRAREASKRLSKFSTEQELEIIQTYLNNHITLKKLSELYKATTPTLRKVLKKHNITIEKNRSVVE